MLLGSGKTRVVCFCILNMKVKWNQTLAANSRVAALYWHTSDSLKAKVK